VRAFIGTRLFNVAGRPVYGGLSGSLPRFPRKDQRIVFWVCFIGTLIFLPLLASWCSR